MSHERNMEVWPIHKGKRQSLETIPKKSHKLDSLEKHFKAL